MVCVGNILTIDLVGGPTKTARRGRFVTKFVDSKMVSTVSFCVPFLLQKYLPQRMERNLRLELLLRLLL